MTGVSKLRMATVITWGLCRLGGRLNLLLILAFCMAAPCKGAAILIAGEPGQESPTLSMFEAVARIYGVGVLRYDMESESHASIPLGRDIRGIVVTGKSFRSRNWTDYERDVLQPAGLSTLPVLVVDVDERRLVGALWTQETPGAQHAMGESVSCLLEIGVSGIAKELAGQSVTCDVQRLERGYFLATLRPDAVTIVSVRSTHNRKLAMFATYVEGTREVFLLAKTPHVADPDAPLLALLSRAADQIAPFAMYIRYVSGEDAWSGPGYFANFTFDDPWLREPYGNLSYLDVLEEMKQVDFHTTIAFIPWNFDRNQSQVVELVKANQAYFSLSIHGNNHDHEEFAPARPLSMHEGNIAQGLARMERLKQLTGLDYDRVMVFPHQIASNDVVALLRRYEFSCTVNLENRRVPVDTSGVTHLWEGFVANESGLPSLKRELPDLNKEQIALRLFLQMPVLVHAHENFLAESRVGTSAGRINELRPDVKWSGLGAICNRLYLTRRRAEGGRAILLFGNTARIKNDLSAEQQFYVTRTGNIPATVTEVIVAGRPVNFTRSAEGVNFSFGLSPHEEATVTIRFADSRDWISDMGVAKNDPRVWALRMVSDFRDTVLSTSVVGRKFSDAYYRAVAGQYGRVDIAIWLLPAFAALSITYTIIWVIIAIRRRRGGPQR